jgi:hypothetical protein
LGDSFFVIVFFGKSSSLSLLSSLSLTFPFAMDALTGDLDAAIPRCGVLNALVFFGEDFLGLVVFGAGEGVLAFANGAASTPFIAVVGATGAGDCGAGDLVTIGDGLTGAFGAGDFGGKSFLTNPGDCGTPAEDLAVMGELPCSELSALVEF